jgi:hypothetical protein
VAVGVLGFCLAALPLALGSFGRARHAATAIEALRPYDQRSRVSRLRDDIARLDRSHLDLVAHRTTQPSGVADFVAQWPAIRDDLSSALAPFATDAHELSAPAALPSLSLLAWLIVAFGLLTAICALAGLGTLSLGLPGTRPLVALGALGVAMMALPVALQLFSRGVLAGELAGELRPLVAPSGITALRRDLAVVDRAADGRWTIERGDLAGLINALDSSRRGIRDLGTLHPSRLPWLFALPGVAVVALTTAARSGGVRGPMGRPITPMGFGADQARVLLDQLRVQAELRRAGDKAGRPRGPEG